MNHHQGQTYEDVEGYFCGRCGNDLTKPVCEKPVVLTSYDEEVLMATVADALRLIPDEQLSRNRDRIVESLTIFQKYRQQAHQRTRLHGNWRGC